jgi:NitT/TauT family transport system substrate-binding protein
MATVLALLLAGCSGTKEQVHIAVTTGLMETFTVYLAKELGQFREEGLDVEIDDFQGGARVIGSLLAGSSDAVYGPYSFTLQVAAQGRSVRSIFLGSETLVSMLVVCPEKARQLRRVEDLKGATVGIAGFGTQSEELVQYILSQHGLALTDVKLVAHGTGPSAIASLQHGKVDAGTIAGSAFAILKRRAPGVRVLVDTTTRQGTKDLTGLDAYPQQSLYSTTVWLDRNPVVARKLTKAMVRTLSWVHTHKAEEVRERLPASFHTEDKDADLETLRIIIDGTSKDGRMPPGAPEGIRRFLAVTNERVRTAKIDLAATYTNQFVDEVSK